MYRRLLRYLRPHSWRMAGTIACNVVAAALDVFSFTLLVPFLNALFGESQLIPTGSPSWITQLQQQLGVQMGGAVEVHPDFGSGLQAAGPPQHMQQCGEIRLGQAAGDFESYVPGVDVQTDKYTQFMVHGVLQRHGQEPTA